MTSDQRYRADPDAGMLWADWRIHLYGGNADAELTVFPGILHSVIYLWRAGCLIPQAVWACSFFKCRNVRHLFSPVPEWKKVPMPQSNTEIRGTSSVPKYFGTGLRCRLLEYRCRRHRPRCRWPAMQNSKQWWPNVQIFQLQSFKNRSKNKNKNKIYTKALCPFYEELKTSILKYFTIIHYLKNSTGKQNLNIVYYIPDDRV